MPDLDTRVRLAAFAFLEEQVRLAGEEGSLRRDLLQAGFIFEGQRVSLVSRQGIFKPRLLAEIPLSITTVAVRAASMTLRQPASAFSEVSPRS